MPGHGYGSWKSPITSQLATQKGISLQEIHLDKASKDGVVYWLELRFEEDGRCVVCSSDGHQWTPATFNARTRVHEYGGGSFFVNKGVVYFSNFSDQRLYVQSSHDATPQPLTPADCGWRYADGYFSEKHNLIFCIREDHSVIDMTTTKEAKNTIIALNPTTQEQHVLVERCDFYARVKPSPDGKKLCWMQWNHPNMPWDSTEVCVATLNEQGTGITSGSTKVVAGGGNSAIFPDWTTDNNLLYLDDKSNWWNLYQVTEDEESVNLAPMSEECGAPHWTFANNTYDVDVGGSGKLAIRHSETISLLDLKTKKLEPLSTGFSSHSHLQYCGGSLYCIAGRPDKFQCVIKVNIDSGKVEVLKEKASCPVDVGYFSIPTKISWPTSEDMTSYGYYYPPQNKDYTGPADSRPPLLVKAHGGPTSNTRDILDLKIQYFTSRGFAVLDVDYRGSTGYGKKYRNLLRRKWGVYDVEDCCSGAQYLANQNKVDKDRLCIDGGSAGGYTTLACLAFKDVFKAGCSHYGICDLEMLAGDTHKFESRYLDTMIGPYSGEHIQVYKDRSPINCIEKFNCPIAFFQGDEDKVVLPNQAETMFNAVKAKGLHTAYVLFKGEQHGFRKAENIQTALDGELYFFSKVFGFNADNNNVKLDIENMD